MQFLFIINKILIWNRIVVFARFFVYNAPEITTGFLWDKYARMNRKEIIPAIVRLLIGFVMMGALLFIPAGTLAYWQAWLLLGLLFVPMVTGGLILMKKAPDRLRKRLQHKEEQYTQQLVIVLSAVMFMAAFIIAGLNYRFGWIVLPDLISYVGAVLLLAAYGLYAEVMRENAWLSRTVEVQEHQQLVDTGLYGIVRHPMYTSTLFLFLAMPLVLGSVISFAIMLLYIPIIAVRIHNEEKVLEAGLEGYTEYKKRVRYRMLPHIY